MYEAPYDPNRKFDHVLEEGVIPAIKQRTQDDNQDFIVLCVGPTGTGKSSLGLWGYELYAGNDAHIDFVALNQVDLANAYYLVRQKPKLRWVMFDEANVMSRDAMSMFNKKFLKLNWGVRGENIAQWWNNPSAEWFDKPFIQEVIHAIIFIIDKNSDVRRYFYFRKTDAIALLEKYGSLTHQVLDQHGEEYAEYQGWFTAYTGPLWEPYMKKKKERMGNLIQDFYEEFGQEKKYNDKQAADFCNVSPKTWQRNKKEGEIPNGPYLKGQIVEIAARKGWQVSG